MVPNINSASKDGSRHQSGGNNSAVNNCSVGSNIRVIARDKLIVVRSATTAAATAPASTGEKSSQCSLPMKKFKLLRWFSIFFSTVLAVE